MIFQLIIGLEAHVYSHEGHGCFCWIQLYNQRKRIVVRLLSNIWKPFLNCGHLSL
ncbi:hypothetical protein EVA_13586 [gut metagenome]|uniref:Uncharacterized protein n=1 Tax=gut metagenome TaxID=749906 RepID=J9CE95_9ZZZZ